MTSSTHLVLITCHICPEKWASWKKFTIWDPYTLGCYPPAPKPCQPLEYWQTISRNNHGLLTWSLTWELRTKFTSCAGSHSQLEREWPSSQSNLLGYSLLCQSRILLQYLFLHVSVIRDLERGRGCQIPCSMLSDIAVDKAS